MASFQNELRTYLLNKLNDATDNPLAALGTTFNLYNRYEVEGEEFNDFVLNSVDWELPDSEGIPADNVVVEYDGVEYNTQLGQYTLDKVNYIPCIIESFQAEYEPLNFLRSVEYTIPVTFYVNENYNRAIDNKIIDAIEVFQDKIRGNIQSIYSQNCLLNHTDITPLTGIIEFNGTIFREYQVVIFLSTIDTGFFGNQIEYRFTIEGVENGTKFRVFPISASTVRSNELHTFQKFSTATTNEFEVKAIPNDSGFMLELGFLYDNTDFTNWLVEQKYNQQNLVVVNLEITYPAISGATPYKVTKDYILETIGGTESVGEKIILTTSLRPVSEVY